jgi:AcrR family transcriptional regulator
VSSPRKRRALAPKKRPSQDRSRETFEALVQACTLLLPVRGYAGTSTNHIARRAGVNIASLYEYFPGKDAIVAQVAERLVERVFAELESGAARILAQGSRDAVRLWIELIHDTLAREKELVAVFVNQVPYTNQLQSIAAIGTRLVELSHQIRARSAGRVSADLSGASLQLLINLVSSTTLQIALDPPPGLTRQALLEELVLRVEDWIREPRARVRAAR